MRTASFGMNISLDGCCDHTSFSPGSDPASNEEFYKYFTGMMDDVDLLFYGRVMYELMFPYWADVAREKTEARWEIEFAERLTSIDKVVVSRTLDSVMENARIVRENPVEELRRLKQLPGKKISVDSVSMLPELINAGLIDEFDLVVHPVIVGKGRHLIDPGKLQKNLKLKLVESRTFKGGQVALHYVKA